MSPCPECVCVPAASVQPPKGGPVEPHAEGALAAFPFLYILLLRLQEVHARLHASHHARVQKLQKKRLSPNKNTKHEDVAGARMANVVSSGGLTNGFSDEPLDWDELPINAVLDKLQDVKDVLGRTSSANACASEPVCIHCVASCIQSP